MITKRHLRILSYLTMAAIAAVFAAQAVSTDVRVTKIESRQVVKVPCRDTPPAGVECREFVRALNVCRRDPRVRCVLPAAARRTASRGILSPEATTRLAAALPSTEPTTPSAPNRKPTVTGPSTPNPEPNAPAVVIPSPSTPTVPTPPPVRIPLPVPQVPKVLPDRPKAPKLPVPLPVPLPDLIGMLVVLQ